MLDPWVIEEILKRERDRRRGEDRPQISLEIPPEMEIPDPERSRPPEPSSIRTFDI